MCTCKLLKVCCLENIRKIVTKGESHQFLLKTESVGPKLHQNTPKKILWRLIYIFYCSQMLIVLLQGVVLMQVDKIALSVTEMHQIQVPLQQHVSARSGHIRVIQGSHLLATYPVTYFTTYLIKKTRRRAISGIMNFDDTCSTPLWHHHSTMTSQLHLVVYRSQPLWGDVPQCHQTGSSVSHFQWQDNLFRFWGSQRWDISEDQLRLACVLDRR